MVIIINETFYVHGVDGDEIKSMVIYNRWGERVYETTSNEPWTGNNCQIGIYTLLYKEHIINIILDKLV